MNNAAGRRRRLSSPGALFALFVDPSTEGNDRGDSDHSCASRFRHQHSAPADLCARRESLTGLSEAILAVYNDREAAAAHTEEYPYYPRTWVSPYIERRRKIGWDLYGLLGITRDDKAKMHHQHGRNYTFFDAPVGMMFTIDRVLEQGSWLDYGMFLQNIAIAARGKGLDTCPQAAFTPYHRIIGEYLQDTADAGTGLRHVPRLRRSRRCRK